MKITQYSARTLQLFEIKSSRQIVHDSATFATDQQRAAAYSAYFLGRVPTPKDGQLATQKALLLVASSLLCCCVLCSASSREQQQICHCLCLLLMLIGIVPRCM